MSTIPAGTTPTVVIEVSLWDLCRQSVVSMPDFTPYMEKYLWREYLDYFTVATNDQGCGPIVTELVGLPGPQFSLVDDNSPNQLVIRTEGVSKD